VKLSKEISVGTILQITAYLVMVIFFAVEIRSQVAFTKLELDLGFAAAKADIARLEKAVAGLTWRLDAHLEQRSPLFNPSAEKGNKK